MRKMHFVVSLLALALISSGVVIARENADKSESSSKSTASRAPRGLVKPWSTLSTLTDEQKDQIIAIHLKANEEVKAIRDKEEADILALLSDEQKAELKSLDEQAKAEAKAKRVAEKKAKEQDGEKKDDDGR